MGNSSAKPRPEPAPEAPKPETAAPPKSPPYDFPEKDLFDRVIENASELCASPGATTMLEGARDALKHAALHNVDNAADDDVPHSPTTALISVPKVEPEPEHDPESERPSSPCSSNGCTEFVMLRHGDVVASSNHCTDFVIMSHNKVVASSNHCTAFVLLDDEGHVVGSSNPCTDFVLGVPPELPVACTPGRQEEEEEDLDVMFMGTRNVPHDKFNPELPWDPERRWCALQKQARFKLPRGFKTTEHLCALRHSCPAFEYRNSESTRIKLPGGFKSAEHLLNLHKSCPVKASSSVCSTSGADYSSSITGDGSSSHKRARRVRSGKVERNHIAALLLGCPDVPTTLDKHLKHQEIEAAATKADMQTRSSRFVLAAQRAPKLFHRARARR